MDCVCVPIRGWMGKRKDLSAFEQGMVVGARHTVWVCQELQRCWVFHNSFPCVYQEWSPTQRTSSQLDTTVGRIGVTVAQHPCGIFSTPCRVHAQTNWGCSEVRRGWGYRNNIPIVLHPQCIIDRKKHCRYLSVDFTSHVPVYIWVSILLCVPQSTAAVRYIEMR